MPAAGDEANFQQAVTSLQLDYQRVGEARPGQEVALKLDQRVHPDDAVFKVSPF